MSNSLNELSATEAAAQIADGNISSEALVRACLERIEAREPDVAAWIYLDPHHALAQARQRDSEAATGPLHGIPVGFKDIVDTADMPTAYGSPIYRDCRPATDAVCVTNTRAAGGIVMGKTVSTEFAFRYPGRTANPHNRLYSPGGSSSGSAAAVADCMVPLAIGTQTGGSVIRPAAYCGVYGYKATYNLLSFAGVRHLAESFDNLGCMARTLDDIALFRSVLMAIPPQPIGAGVETPPRIAFCRTPYWQEAQDATRELIEGAAGRFAAAGADVVNFELPPSFDDILDLTWQVTHFECARCFAYDYAEHAESISGAVRDAVEAGRAVPYERYIENLRTLESLRTEIHAALDGFDAILTPSAVGEAPLGLGDTGPITFNFLWTVLHMPAITLPLFSGPNDLPIGAQLVARRHDDDRLLAIARWVERHIG
jgi:Asp-tRNA(Asn)/Glu-tRNA(Gln) amidotransferase A subunit family amidase